MAALKTLDSNPATVVATDTEWSEVQFSNDSVGNTENRFEDAKIEVTTGTIQFTTAAVGSIPDPSDAPSVAVNGRLIVGFKNGIHNIFYKAGTIADAFTISM